MSQRFLVTVETTGYAASDTLGTADVLRAIDTAFTNDLCDLRVIMVREEGEA